MKKIIASVFVILGVICLTGCEEFLDLLSSLDKGSSSTNESSSSGVSSTSITNDSNASSEEQTETETTEVSEVKEPESSSEISVSSDDSEYEESSSQESVDSLYYSTNDLNAAKKGNSGVFAYSKKNSGYTIYYIIDFDENCIYRFTEGNGDETCMKARIESGDLNSVLIIEYNDGGSVFYEGLHFKWKKQPDHPILEDSYHDEYDFYPTNLKDALKIKEALRVVNY